MNKVIEEIAAERQRQIDEEGFDERHDDQFHQKRELSFAAICYAAPEPIYVFRSHSQAQHLYSDPWPWHVKWDKREQHDLRRRLIIAAALIAADIEQLDREHAERE
jgi:hypothetical protein